jgi:hypothetical protein
MHEEMFNIIKTKIQIKTKLRFHLTSVGTAIIKKISKKGCQGCKENRAIYVGGNGNDCSHYENWFGVSSKT